MCLVCATFPLIWVGGMVTTCDAGMAVPDWPNTFGYNMFLYPLSTWISGPWTQFIEHGHRLLGAAVGMLTIAALVSVVRREPRRWVRWYGVGLLLAVIGQGALGGLRVLFDERLLAKIHACTGPLFFALCVALAAFTSDYWRHASRSAHDASLGKLHRLSTLTLLLTYAQIVLGAQLRHATTTLAPSAFAGFVVFHLVVAAALWVHAVLLARCLRQHFADQSLLVRPGNWLVALVSLQIALGLGTWVLNFGWPAWFDRFAWTGSQVVLQASTGQTLTTTAHVACGSLILVTAALITLRAWRLVQPTWRRPVGAPTLLGVAA